LPNRIIKESVCSSDNLDRLSWFEEVLFYRLIVNCDDFGRMDARPAIIRARLFPLKSLTDSQIEKALTSLRSAAMIDLYEVDGRSYLQMRTWNRHQSIRAKKSKYPAPDDVNTLASNCMQMQADVPVIQSNPNPNPSMKTRARFTPPTVDEVDAYCKERGNGVDAQKFVDFYASKGWMVGKNSMKDWKAAVRTWEKGDSSRSPAQSQREMTVEELYGYV
jgi:hypothetical protein